MSVPQPRPHGSPPPQVPPSPQGYAAPQGYPVTQGHQQWPYPQQPAPPGFPPPSGHSQPPGFPAKPASNGPRIAFAVVLCVLSIFFVEEGVVSILDNIAASRIVFDGQTQVGLNTALSILRGAGIVLAGLLALTAAILHFTRAPAARALALAVGGAAVLSFLLNAVYELHTVATTHLRFNFDDIVDTRFVIVLVLGSAIAGLSFVPAIRGAPNALPPMRQPYPPQYR